MDYEKKYNEALKRAEAAINIAADKDLVKGVATTIFPELAESEEEKIRREIVDFICWAIDRGSITEEQRERSDTWLAYLEKQKLPTDEEMLRTLRAEYEKGVADTIAKYKQKEQKEIPLMNGDADLYFDEWNQQNQNPTKRQCFEEGMRYAQKLQKEQKPEEKPINWTELTWKDIDKLEGIINNVHYEFRNGIGQESFGKEVLEKFREYKGDEYLDEKEQKPLSTEETELNSLAFLSQMGYTCIPPKKEHQNNSDAPKNALGGALNSPLDKDKNLDDIAQDYVEAVKEYNPEPTWDLMQTAVCYGYHYREGEEQRSASTEDMPYITDEHFFEREPADSFRYKLAEYMTKNCRKEESTEYGHTYHISAETILKMAEEELLKRGVVQKPAEWSEEDERMRDRLITRLNWITYNTRTDGTSPNITFFDEIDWLKSLPLQLKEAYKDGFQTARHATALTFMNYLDENRPDGKMGLSNGECEDIDKAFKENDWAKIMRYVEKYSPQPKVELSEDVKKTLDEVSHILVGLNYKQIAKDYKQAIEKLLSLRPQPHTVSVENATKFGNLEYERGVKDGIQSEKSRHWKPSEEQMEALRVTIDFMPDTFKPRCTLITLQNGLEKLM